MIYCMAILCPATQQKMMFPSFSPLEQVVPICWYCCHIKWANMWCASLRLWECVAFVKAGTWLWCFVVSPKNGTRHASSFFVLRDGSNGWQELFTPQEHSVGARGDSFDGAIVRIFEVYTPDRPNSYCRALYHSFALAKTFDNEGKVGDNENWTNVHLIDRLD